MLTLTSASSETVSRAGPLEKYWRMSSVFRAVLSEYLFCDFYKQKLGLVSPGRVRGLLVLLGGLAELIPAEWVGVRKGKGGAGRGSGRRGQLGQKLALVRAPTLEEGTVAG